LLAYAPGSDISGLSGAGGADIRLSDELVAERRAETKAEEDDH